MWAGKTWITSRRASATLRQFKIQGQTLEHVTLWLDRPFCRAAGYVALSRVRCDEDYLVAGDVTPQHFIPAM